MPAGRPETWDEDASAKLAEDMVDWLQEDESNIFWEKFIVIIRGHDAGIIGHLRDKFKAKKYDEGLAETAWKVKRRDEFFQALKRAEKIQELKLAEKTMDNRSVAGACFVLKNKHNWADKQEVKQETRQINVDAAQLTSKSLEELLSLQEDLARD